MNSQQQQDARLILLKESNSGRRSSMALLYVDRATIKLPEAEGVEDLLEQVEVQKN
ncbi:hypothetical protein Sjap_002892 [Stephania japonica]|uniref:Uncharacterized protein n=1 Tax=Stephania japonica TaxID=461633 RepID=A0AAP0KMP6_9MAGN